MPSPRRRRRSPGRYLAPLALVAVGVAVYAVAHPSTSKDTATTSTQRTTTGARTKTSAQRAKKPKPRTYTVKSGDTLSGIAAKTGVSLARIEALNPKLDAGALQTGETIKLGP